MTYTHTAKVAASSPAPAVTTPLRVGASHDRFETEADQVADAVASGKPAPWLVPSARPTGLQRRCAACQEEDPTLRRVAAGAGAGAQHAPAAVSEVLRSSGRPLAPETRAFMEPRLGHDLRDIRIHDDAAAAASARAVDAHAYTVRNHIVFATNQYAPDSRSGRHLLAHELAHVVQQRSAGPAAPVLQRRTVRRSYATTDSPTGRLCDVRLEITGAPARDTEHLADFVESAMNGIRSACASVQSSPTRNIRVRMAYDRRLEHAEISQRAWAAARVSVLGPSADPAEIRAAAERERVARMSTAFDTAVRDQQWGDAAEQLNGFNDADIDIRLQRLGLDQLAELRRGAAGHPRLGGGARLTAAIDRTHPDARRVATLYQRYDDARRANDWAAAAEHLNGMSADDIRARLARLSPPGLSLLRDGAIRNPALGRGDRLVRMIDAATTASPLNGVGAACYDGTTITVTKNRVTESCAAITGTAGAPTPNGRFCMRMQGDAQTRGGTRGALLETLGMQNRSSWYLLEPQFTTSRSRMMLHPGRMSSGCITVTDAACFTRLAAVLNQTGLDSARGYDGYPPGNAEGVTNPERNVLCTAWLDVTSTSGGCRP